MAERPIFTPSFGNRPEQLIGREEIIQQILDGLNSYPGSQHRATLVVGQRGMGKTALLMEIADRAATHDFIAIRTTCGEGMLDNIIELLQRAGNKFIEGPKAPIQGFSAGALGFSVGLTFTEDAERTFGFRVKLEMICEKLMEAGRGVLLLIDEVDPNYEQMRALATAYQEIAGEEKNIAIVMAGLPSSISETLTTKTLTFLNRAEQITLEPIPIFEVETYYSKAFKRMNRTIDPSLVRQAAEATEGFPYMLQLLGYNLIELTNEGDEVTQSLLDEALSLARRGMETRVFEAMLKPLSNTDLSFLRAMTQDSGPTKIGDLESRLELTQGTIQTYRRRLIDAGVITSQRRGEVSFISTQLKEYIKNLSH